MTFREVCKKQVVQTMDGTILGKVDDLVLDDTGRQIRAFILYGTPRLFGILGREPDLRIPIEKVKMFGVDVLLVETEEKTPPPSPKKSWKAWFSD